MFAVQLAPDSTRGVGVAFTDRYGGVSAGSLGSLNLGRTDVDDVAAIEANFARVRTALGVPVLVALSQVHGAQVVVVDEEFVADWGPRSHLGAPGGQRSLPHADAMVTRMAEVGLVIRVADCLPVLLADETGAVMGAAHAGREGFLAGVLDQTVQAMRALGAGALTAWIGPHICGPCYEVDQATADRVTTTHPEVVITSRWGTPALDLARGAEQQLAESGVSVVRVDPCTRERDDLHSHRRDGAGAGRLAGIIWRVSPLA